MQKTKLGISVALMGAGLYFLGIFSFIHRISVSGICSAARGQCVVKEKCHKNGHYRNWILYTPYWS